MIRKTWFVLARSKQTASNTPLLNGKHVLDLLFFPLMLLRASNA